jgi:hypothetical protein
MNTNLISVEVRPGLLLRMRPEEAARFGYGETPAKHKSARPAARKAVKKAVEVVEEEEES